MITLFEEQTERVFSPVACSEHLSWNLVNFSLGIYEHDNHAWICIKTIVWDCVRLPEWGGVISINKQTLEWLTCGEKESNQAVS